MTYPVDPTTGQTKKPGPPLWLAILLLVLGAAMGITGVAVGVSKVVHEFSGTVYTAPGSVNRHLTPGTYEIFEAVTHSGSNVPEQGQGITGVRVSQANGSTLSVFRPSSRETISRGSTHYLGIVEFKVAQTGDYTIQVAGSPGEQFFVTSSFGDLAKHAAGWFVLMGAGILVGIIGLVLLIVGIVRRSRAKRPAAYAGGYPAAGYAQPAAAQPAPGWYPDPQTPGLSRWWDGTRWTDQTHSPD